MIDRVWLDAPAEALDADSAPQIGAPQAWESGATGKGVRIAILDTGIDPTHPDLDESSTHTTSRWAVPRWRRRTSRVPRPRCCRRGPS